jgi:tetratricopeptide (TPR) repeat protein
MKVFGTMLVCVVVLVSAAQAVGGIEEERRALGGPQLAEDNELPFLPPYCRCWAAVNMDRYRHERSQWRRIFRGHWSGIHHYCYGLIMLSRLERGVGQRSALLAWAESQFDYVLTHATPETNILYPEVHLKMGITKKLMGKNAEAMKHFYEAIRLKKDYVAAYAYIIDFFKEHQNYKAAIEIAQRGLRYSPNSELLKKKLTELQALSGAK